jgi:hypothetical protein
MTANQTGNGLTFTDQDRADLKRLEGVIKDAVVQTFTALREIRTRKLYLLAKDAKGKPYTNFDSYVEERFGHTRQWVTQGTQWLEVKETMSELGIKDKLAIRAAQAFSSLPEGLDVPTILKEVVGDDLPLTEPNIRACIERQGEFLTNAVGITYPEFKQLKADIARKEAAVTKAMSEAGAQTAQAALDKAKAKLQAVTKHEAKEKGKDKNAGTDVSALTPEQFQVLEALIEKYGAFTPEDYEDSGPDEEVTAYLALEQKVAEIFLKKNATKVPVAKPGKVKVGSQTVEVSPNETVYVILHCGPVDATVGTEEDS